MKSHAKYGLVFLVVVATQLWVDMAQAQGPHAKAQAENLFTEGRALLDDKNYDEACPKFSESNRLDPHTATLLNLGHCYEMQGSVTKAWVAFQAAGALALKQGRQDRVATATARSQKLEAGRASVTILLSEPKPTPSVTLDDIALDAQMIGKSIPVVAGAHHIVATAQGRKPWRRDFQASKSGNQQVRVPALEEAPVTVDPFTPDPTPAPNPVPAPAPLTTTSWFSTQRTIGMITLGLGVVTLGVGGVLGAMTLSKADEVDAACPTANACTTEGLQLNDSAHTLADASTALFIAGGIVASAGLVVLLTGSDDVETAFVVAPGFTSVTAMAVQRW